MPNTGKELRQKVLLLGRAKVIIILTIMAMFIASMIDLFVAKFLGAHYIIGDIVRTSLVVLIVTPFVSWYPISLLFELDRLEKKMSKLATYDDLTGLYNRREFYSHCQKLHQYAMRHKQPYCALVIDLDNFKAINDRCGHATGDKVLAEFGRILRQQSRDGDISGRLGGEEFGFFLPKTNIKQAEHFAERLREVTASTQTGCDNQLIQYTASIGIAGNVYNPKLPVEQVFNNADHALYTAKDNGRNQVFIFSPT